MRLIFEFWQKRIGWLLFLVVFTGISTIIFLSFPYVLKYIIDGIQNRLATKIILKYVFILFFFGLARSFLSVLLPFSRGRTNEQFMWSVRNDVYKQIIKKGHSFINRFPSGDVIERLDQDLGELSWFGCSGIFRPLEGIFTIILALIILFRLNSLLTFLSLLPVSITIFFWIKLGPVVYKRYREWREKISEVNNLLESSFSGIKLVKSYTMEERSGRRFRQTLNERIAKAIQVVKAEALIGILFTGVSEISILLVLWVGGTLVIQQSLTVGEFVVFNAYVLMLITPMFDIGNFFVAGKRAQAGSARILALREFPPDVADETAQRKVPVLPEITFSEVSFRYDPNGSEVLRNINLVFRPGTKIGIAGTLGSGKSTLIRLLFRLADPTSGVVRLNGVNIQEVNLKELRNLFGYAPQEPNLFSDTIRNNIIFGRKVESEEIRKVIEIAQLESELKDFSRGIDEMIGERGIRLSGGQKERVAIARALLSKPKIIIFDDATSSLDSETEKDLIKEVLAYAKDSTLIIVSHRLSILSICDYIYVLDKGEIVESGTHEELLTKHNLYWKLYERQLIAEEMERI